MLTSPESKQTVIEIWICGGVWDQELYICWKQAVKNFMNSVAKEHAYLRKYSILLNDIDLSGKYNLFQ